MRGLNLSNPGFVAVAGGGGAAPVLTPDITGTLTIAYSGAAGYGYSPGLPQQFIQPWGSRTSDPSGIIQSFLYNTNNGATQIQFTPGTYLGANGELVVSDNHTVNGSSTYLVTVGGVSETLISNSFSANIAGDPFNIAGQNGNTVNFEITLM